MKTTAFALASCFVVMNAFANTAVEATNKLGLKLAREASKTALQAKNFMVSPLSLSQAVILAGNGTDHATRAELETLLGADLNSLNADSAANVKSISFSKEQAMRIRTQAPFANPSVLSVNNSIWNTNGATDRAHFEYSASFKKVAKDDFNAEVLTADFQTQAGADAINGWADKKTYGLVKKIIDLVTLKDLLWVVMNATYMEASWAEPFYLMGVNTPAFMGLDHQPKKVAMITAEQGIGYAKIQGGEVASLAFARGFDAPEIQMVIYLPTEGTALEKSQDIFFDDAFLKKTATLLEKNVELARVTMPKFSFDTSVEMKNDDELTKAIGLQFLFDEHADFSMMQTPESLASVVGLIRQNSRIELDEKGVKAAAVTIVGGIRATSVRPSPTLSFVVNRPFHFALVEKKSNTVLFAGTVVEPK
ncbi:MAG: serpin family protein [Bacteriovoracaceae bacterium]